MLQPPPSFLGYCEVAAPTRTVLEGMKPHLESVRKRENPGKRGAKLGSISRLANEHGVAKPYTLLLEPVKQRSRPDEFGGKNSEA